MSTQVHLDLDDFFDCHQDGPYMILEFKNRNSKLIIYDPGLHHTAHCKSDLCTIDKTTGKLYYRNIPVEEKLDNDYLDIAFDLIFAGSEKERDFFKQKVAEHLTLRSELKAVLDAIPFQCHPMDTLAMAMLSLGSIETKYLKNHEDFLEKAAWIVASVAITVSYRYVLTHGKKWEERPLNGSYAAHVLHLMHPDQNASWINQRACILQTILILHAEHGQNCSAVAVRTVTSAQSSIYGAVASGMSAFNGMIHGGASELVSQMYEDFSTTELDIDTYVKDKIATQKLLMGFGQRTYNKIEGVWDPRCLKMYEILKSENFNFPEVENYKKIAINLINRVIDDPFFKKRNLTPNPDLFNCIFYKLFGVPKEMNTCMLGLGRIAGWIANFREHQKDRYPLTRPFDLERK